MNADVRELCGVSAATANRILAGFVSERKLVKRQALGILYQFLDFISP